MTCQIEMITTSEPLVIFSNGKTWATLWNVQKILVLLFPRSVNQKFQNLLQPVKFSKNCNSKIVTMQILFEIRGETSQGVPLFSPPNPTSWLRRILVYLLIKNLRKFKLIHTLFFFTHSLTRFTHSHIFLHHLSTSFNTLSFPSSKNSTCDCDCDLSSNATTYIFFATPCRES